tara:strand:+ start:1316 stop:1519 length:204 start_codon:yes stop_codon:yes gene_type:complete
MSDNKNIVITSSPYPWDDNLPWEYTLDSFLAWHEEVFREGYKKDNSPMGVDERIYSLEAMGYKISYK